MVKLETRLCRPATLSYEPAWQVGDCKNAFEVPMSYRQGFSATLCINLPKTSSLVQNNE